MPKPLDVSGQRFGKLIAVERLPRGSRTSRVSHWRCACDCGKETAVSVSDLKAGKTRSCGCHRSATTKARRTTHGHSADGKTSRTYTTWAGMRHRCADLGHVNFAYYGGRGVTVCERWRSFENFLADMGEKPPGTSIDRIDPAGNYEPGNCRWATVTEQSRNRPGFVKLNPESVKEIRVRHERGESAKSLARQFDVSPGMIYFVVQRKAWADVP